MLFVVIRRQQMQFMPNLIKAINSKPDPTHIKNIVFDIGNVLVRWDPLAIVSKAFPEHTEPHTLALKLLKEETWLDLNRGIITEQEAIQQYHQALNIHPSRLENLMQVVRKSLTPLEGSFELVEKLHQAGYLLYIISDNTNELVAYLREQYNFWDKFTGVVISSEIGVLKPSPIIYHHLLDTYLLNPKESIFLDDLEANVKGAKAVNMHSIQFVTAQRCIEDLRTLNINI